MKNLKDDRTKTIPSKMRGGKELPSCSTPDSPFVLSKLATPQPAIISNMLQAMMPLLLCMMLVLWMGSLSILFSINVLIQWFPMKILTKLQVLHPSLLFLLWWIQFKLSVLITFLSLFQMLFLAGAPLNRSSLFIHIRSAEDISKDPSFHSQFVQTISRLLSYSSHLTQPVQSLFKSFQRCFFWLGPNPQVFSQDLTWLF